MSENEYDSDGGGQGGDVVPIQLFNSLGQNMTYLHNGHLEEDGTAPMDDGDVSAHQPYIEISEQPQARGFRFRYECEGPSHGGLQGEKSEKYKRTYPAITIKNYVGPARVVVSLVTDEVIPRPHAHKLVGKNCSEGSCIVELKTGQNTATFPNLCIQHVTRKKAAEVIQQRIIESMKLDKLVKIGNLNAEAELSDSERATAKQQAEKQAKDMQLNVVKLCFQAYLRDENGQFSRLLQSVLSNPIYDSKSPGANALKICRMDKYGGCCTGNEEVFLLCERVQKDDIAVRFVEQDDDGQTVWEAYGNFGPFDVHRQYAIVFKTPPYRDQNIDRAVNVIIMLQRKSDGESSDPKSFTYYPQNFDKEEIAKKRKKLLPSYPGSGGSGGTGRTTGGVSNGFLPGLPTFSVPSGNLPVTVNQQDSCSVTVKNHTSGRGRGRGSGRGRPRKSSPTESVDLETDSDSVQNPYSRSLQHSKPSISPRPPVSQALPTTILMDSQSDDIGSSNSHVNPVGPPDFNPNFPTTINFFPHLSYSPQQQQQQQIFIPQANQAMFNSYVSRGQSSPVNYKVDRPSDSPDSGAGEDEVDCAPFRNMTENISQYHEPVLQICGDGSIMESISQNREPVLQRRGDGGGGVVSPHLVKQKDIVFPHEVIKQKTELQTDLQDKYEIVVDLEPDITKDVNIESQIIPVIEDTVKQREEEIMVPVMKEAVLKREEGGMAIKFDVSVQTDKDGAYKVAERTANALQWYAATGDVRCLLMAQRYLLPIRDENGDLPLHTSIINNQLEVVHNVLDTMVTLPNAIRHINTYNYLLQTPLHLAVLTNQPGVVDRLLCAGANPTLPDRCGNTPAHLAVLSGSDSCLKVLIKYLRPGVSKTEPFPELNMLNFDGFSPAHLAAQTGSLSAMKLLVHGKADINLADGKSGRSPLHYSVETDDLSVSGYLLLEAGALVNVTCFDGNTALHIACGRQNVGMVALLMAAGADPSAENYDTLNDDNDNDDAKKAEKPKLGHLPEDFAYENEKVLKVLHGEPYTNILDITKEAEETEHEQVTSMMTSLSVSSMSGLSGVGLFKDGSDMDQLKYPIRVQLSKLLDPRQEGRDWLALSDKLSLRRLVENIGSGHSQTRALLNYYEECGGTIHSLKEALKAINRDDAANIIQEPPSSDKTYQRSSLHDCCQVDSGVETSIASRSPRQIEAS